MRWSVAIEIAVGLVVPSVYYVIGLPLALGGLLGIVFAEVFGGGAVLLPFVWLASPVLAGAIGLPLLWPLSLRRLQGREPEARPALFWIGVGVAGGLGFLHLATTFAILETLDPFMTYLVGAPMAMTARELLARRADSGPGGRETSSAPTVP